MGVYIKGMEIPKTCNECPLHFYEGQGICSCRVLHAIDDGEILKPWENKRKDCPIISVLPHGRLIDADAIGMNYIYIRDDGMKIYTQRAIDNAPTIIPAEEGEE